MNTSNDMAHCHDLGSAFSAVASKQPEKVAIKYGDGTEINYAALDRLSSQIAGWLLSRDVNMYDVVGIFHDKSATPYAIMLACLKIGAIYVNIDMTSPSARVFRIVETAKPRILFYGHELQERMKALLAEMSTAATCMDYSTKSFISEIKQCLPLIKNTGVSGNTPAYLMFTSGSTGYPKGAAISHQNVLNFIRWAKQDIGCDHLDVFTNINPMHFDNSVFDFYIALFSGGTLAPISERLAKQPRRMVKYIEQMGCTLWFSVPSMLVYVLRMRALEPDDIPTLKRIVFGGEGFPKNHLRTLHQLIGHRIELINVYGPTECTCICSIYRVTKSDLNEDALLPLGPMAANFTFQIVDKNLVPVNSDEIGELLIGGPNVGLGYYRDPQKTASAFIQNPAHTDYRDIMYRSGDLVRRDTVTGVLQFAGRKDFQIKRMGYRIELEEIETAFNAMADVEEVACISVTNGDRVYIYACVNSECDEASLLSQLRERLPIYMIPDEIRYFRTLPKNQNGKIDRVALKEEMIA